MATEADKALYDALVYTDIAWYICKTPRAKTIKRLVKQERRLTHEANNLLLDLAKKPEAQIAKVIQSVIPTL